MPYETGGTIALRRDDLPAAETLFRDALERDPRNAYAALQLGGILSLQGRREEAIPLLERAIELAPRDPLNRLALRQARTGRVNLEAINERILEQVRALGDNTG